MVTTVNHPLSWYVDKIKRGEPFSSLLYGDGEFIVAMGERMGQAMQNGEIVTESLRRGICESLLVQDQNIVRGTDLNLINYEDYKGRDAASFCEYGVRIRKFLAGYPPLEFTDGVVWENAVRAGELGPFLRALKGKEVVLVGNPLLKGFNGCRFADLSGFVPVPKQNAASMLNILEVECVVVKQGKAPVYLVCMGLGAIPLIMRLRRQIPQATFLDLGSTFDMFVGLGTERGWRQDLYRDQKAWDALIEKNLEGV